uniref:Uncharacterized protein n=1 Tax=Leersia perrieri TaxID=77586 RepID=A0A0D9XLW0_9ORYZ
MANDTSENRSDVDDAKNEAKMEEERSSLQPPHGRRERQDAHHCRTCYCSKRTQTAGDPSACEILLMLVAALAAIGMLTMAVVVYVGII